MKQEEQPAGSSNSTGRSRFRRYLPLLLALVPVAIVAYVTGRSPRGLRPFLLVGQPAPAVTAVTLEMQPYQFRSHGWRLVHFWTSSCSECRGEVPELRRFAEKSRDAGVSIELLNVNIQDPVQTVAQYAAQFGLAPTVLSDADGKMARSYGVTGVPESFFVDAKGVIRHHMVGAATTEEFERVLELLQKSSSDLQSR